MEQSEAATDLMIRRFQKTHGLFAQVPADNDLRSRHCDRGCESSRVGRSTCQSPEHAISDSQKCEQLS